MTGTPAGSRGREADELGRILRLVCETPAPTFQEGERARVVAGLLSECGLSPRFDEAGNVLIEVPGGSGPRVMLAAHLDTVFGPNVDVRVRVDGDRWRAPGVGDNSASLAVLVLLLRRHKELQGLPRLTVAATVGEEGLGDLRGARALVRPPYPDFFVAVDGHLGTVVDSAVGSRRFVAKITAAGGHSWGDYPAPSATHAVATMVASLGGLDVPPHPRSSYNVGQIWGGTGVNSIAQEAGFNLDLRSVDPGMLERLERDASQRLRRVARRQRVELTLEKVGDRPAAEPGGRELPQLALDALADVGVKGSLTASSTDANVAMAAGVPAIAFGVYRGGDAHRLSEWLERSSLETGYQALLGLLNRLAGEESAQPPTL